MLFNGSRAVICRELIMSNKGCIETPKKNPTHELVAMRVNIVDYAVSGFIPKSSSTLIWGGNVTGTCHPSGIGSLDLSSGSIQMTVLMNDNIIVSGFSPVEMYTGFSKKKLNCKVYGSICAHVQLNPFISMYSVVHGMSSIVTLFVSFSSSQIIVASSTSSGGASVAVEFEESSVSALDSGSSSSSKRKDSPPYSHMNLFCMVLYSNSLNGVLNQRITSPN